MSNRMWIYIITDENRIKIGMSGDPQSRMATIGSQSGLPLLLHAAFEVPPKMAREIEGEAHRKLQSSRTIGEWFETLPESAEAVILQAIVDAVQRRAIRRLASPAVVRKRLYEIRL